MFCFAQSAAKQALRDEGFNDPKFIAKLHRGEIKSWKGFEARKYSAAGSSDSAVAGCERFFDSAPKRVGDGLYHHSQIAIEVRRLSSDGEVVTDWTRFPTIVSSARLL